MDRDVKSQLAALVELVENARSVPMSSSCLVDRGELLGALRQLSAGLPASLDEADRVLRERETVVAEGRAQADRIRGEAATDQAQLVSSSEVVRLAEDEAAAIRAAARDESAVMRQEVDAYVDARLESLEGVLDRALDVVRRGRDRVRTHAATTPVPGGTGAELASEAAGSSGAADAGTGPRASAAG